MRRLALCPALVAGLSVSSTARADGDAQRGAQVYRACVACRALELGLHLSGPSLDGFMGRMAGTAEEFVRYSSGLQDAGFSWNAAALDGWLKDPAGMIPGTYMTFRGIDDPKARADLVAFLEMQAQQLARHLGAHHGRGARVHGADGADQHAHVAPLHHAHGHRLRLGTHGAGAVTDRAEIFAVLYRKFVIAAAAHIVALRNHRN